MTNSQRILGLVLCGVIIIGGISLYKIGKKDPFSLSPFCGAMSCVAGVFGALAMLLAN